MSVSASSVWPARSLGTMTSVGQVSPVAASQMIPSPPTGSLQKVSLPSVAALAATQTSQFADDLPVWRCWPLRTNGSISLSAAARLLNCVTGYFMGQGVLNLARPINRKSASKKVPKGSKDRPPLRWSAPLVLLFQTAPRSRIARMSWVERPSVDTDCGRVASTLDLRLSARMTMRTQRLQLTEPKRVDIALVRYDVVDDTRCSEPAFALAHPTERLDLQLIARPFAPTFAVQMTPLTHAQYLAHLPGREQQECGDARCYNAQRHLLEREDCTPVAWYRFPYAPRAGGGV